MSGVINWIKGHKALLGVLLTFVSGGLDAIGHPNAAKVVLAGQGALILAGNTESDAFHQGK